MTIDGSTYLNQYAIKNPKSYKGFDKALNILKQLLKKLQESYLIGSCVRNLIMNKETNMFSIITTASPELLINTIPNLINQKGRLVLKEDGFIYSFITFSQDINPENKTEFYNKKIADALEKELFTLDALVMSPKLVINDLYNGIEDIKNKEINLVSNANSIIKDNPSTMLRALKYWAELDFNINKQLLRSINHHYKLFSHLSSLHMASFIRTILKMPNGKKVLTYISRNDLFAANYDYQLLVEKLCKHEELTYVERLTLLYLNIGSIPDASFMTEEEQIDVSEHLLIARLLLNQTVTPMIVYNIGEKILLSCDKVAKIYKSKYRSQANRIRKLSNSKVITNVRELNFTKLELVALLNGERSIRVTPILNILLERVINGDVPNYNKFLKKEALKIIDEMNEIFNYEEPDYPISYTDDMIISLKEKYEKEYKFLQRVYLNDEKSLYDLSAVERHQVKEEASNHAKEFLLSTSQYKVLQERGLI